MHELSITQQIVETCCEVAGGTPVASVTVEIGCLCAVLPSAVSFCYEVCTEGTPLEGSVLQIVSVPARGRCRECKAESMFLDFRSLCRCGSADLEFTGGDELRIKEMELA
jgi:hydrogenase nickel incorporation protein HypA/HybF